jgi:hypothetical protein
MRKESLVPNGFVGPTADLEREMKTLKTFQMPDAFFLRKLPWSFSGSTSGKDSMGSPIPYQIGDNDRIQEA